MRSLIVTVLTAFTAALLFSAVVFAKPLTTNGGETIETEDLAYCTQDKEAPVVYYTSEITPESLVKIYQAMEWSNKGPTAVKISSGEPPMSNYLRPELIEDLVKQVDGTIVDSNTAYGGERAATAQHYMVAEEHGYTDIAEFQVLDEDGSMELPVTGGERLTGNLVGAHFKDYGSFVVLSHFKGHQMAGYGGAIKNASIGIASAKGKVRIHSGGTSDTHWHDELQTEFLEAMAEAAKSVKDYLGDQVIFINVMNRLSIDCDCNGNPAEPDIHDIGILASTDPAAVDQACIDLVRKAKGNKKLLARIKERMGLHTLEHAEKIGLGSRHYRLVNLDD